MMIMDKVMEQAQKSAAQGGQTIKKLVVGLKFISMELSDGKCGISFRFPDDAFHYLEKNPTATEASTLPLREIIGWAGNCRSLLRSGIALAAINALTPWDEIESFSKKDSAEAADIKEGDTVGMIGFFPPLVRELSKRDIDLRIFERTYREPHPCLYPDWAENRMLPECDVVIVTGTSSINGTLDQLLSWCSKARQVSVTGPSTPMYPKAYEGTNATILAGAKLISGKKQGLFDSVTLGVCGSETFQYMEKIACPLS